MIELSKEMMVYSVLLFSKGKEEIFFSKNPIFPFKGCSQGRKQKFLAFAILLKSIPNYFLKSKPLIYIVALMLLDQFIRFVTLQLQSLS